MTTTAALSTYGLMLRRRAAVPKVSAAAMPLRARSANRPVANREPPETADARQRRIDAAAAQKAHDRLMVRDILREERAAEAKAALAADPMTKARAFARDMNRVVADIRGETLDPRNWMDTPSQERHHVTGSDLLASARRMGLATNTTIVGPSQAGFRGYADQ